jgi:hypothetical protein
MTSPSEQTIEMFPQKQKKQKRPLTSEEYIKAVERARVAREGKKIALAKRKKSEAQKKYYAKCKARKAQEEQDQQEKTFDAMAKEVKEASVSPKPPEAPWLPPPVPPVPEVPKAPPTEALIAKIASLEHQTAQYRIVIDYLESKVAHLTETLSSINRKRAGAPF